SYRAFRFLWPVEDQSTTVSRFELLEGNDYVFNDVDVNENTGVTLEVDTLEGPGWYNEVYVTREPYAPSSSRTRETGRVRHHEHHGSALF
ncbi:MAG: hypothetical protein ACYTDW_22260, partial [Planctomycetota bacterium]